MPKRPSKDWQEPFLEALTKTRNADKAASVGVKRDMAYRHYSEDAAFAERWDAALKRRTAFPKFLSLPRNITLFPAPRRQGKNH